MYGNSTYVQMWICTPYCNHTNNWCSHVQPSGRYILPKLENSTVVSFDFFRSIYQRWWQMSKIMIFLLKFYNCFLVWFYRKQQVSNKNIKSYPKRKKIIQCNIFIALEGKLFKRMLIIKQISLDFETKQNKKTARKSKG